MATGAPGNPGAGAAGPAQVQGVIMAKLVRDSIISVKIVCDNTNLDKNQPKNCIFWSLIT